jgi:hypothetical protein
MANNPKVLLTVSVFFLFLIATAVFMVFKGDFAEESNPDPANSPDGFTFFEVGPETALTEKLKDDLEKKLGSGPVETWSTINLEFVEPGFLEKHFPALHELNRRLTGVRGQRVEHNTVRLTFRYITGDIYPFDYVELLFSGYTGLPLYGRIRAEKPGDEIVSVL